jgi:alpha-L-fucosidase
MTRHRFAAPLVLALLVATTSAGLTAGQAPANGAADRGSAQAESPAARDQRMRWWREARFGMFIHWGLYAVPAGEYHGKRGKDIGEWIMSWANIPRAEYETFAARFNPVAFDAAQWVRIAKDAGMKYIVITSKHHDGFSMFDSAASTYDIVEATPYKKDVIKALAAEAKRQGLQFCFYYSIMDWHHPSQAAESPVKDPTAGDRKTTIRPGQKPEYVAYMKAQLKELVTSYDPEVFWFDGEWVDWWTEPDGQDLYAYVQSLKPSIIVNNRVGKGRKGLEGLSKDDQHYAGDFGTPEQQIPASGLKGVDWETCMTMNDTWGFKSYDENWKSAETLVRQLVDAASKGGNYLLNVGPTAEGRIPQPSVDRLAAMGRWIRVNGEAIYGTTAGPFTTPLTWGRATSKPGVVYLHVFDWPATGDLRVPAFEGTVKSARLLANRDAQVPVSATPDGITLRLPVTAPDPIASVVALELE